MDDASTDRSHSADHDPPQLEQIVARFEEAWQRGERPAIEDHLPADDKHRGRVLVELVHAELELRIKAGERVRVEAYLERYPELTHDREAVLDLIAAEYDLRRRREPELSLAEFVLRFPQHAELLATRLQPQARPRRHRFPIRLNCPHCQNPIAIVDDGSDEVVCPSCGSTFRLDPDRTTSWSPEKLPKLGKFELLVAVGRGAFGTVYRARDTELDRIVAVKVPRSGQLSTKEDEERFVKEARAAAQLRDPGIVPVYDVGRTGEFPYIVTEFVEGVTLASALTAGRFSFREAAELVAEVAESLDHAHRQGIVHRDLKPSNIMLERAGVRDQGPGVREERTVREPGRPATETQPDSTLNARPPSPPPSPLDSRPSFRPRLMDFGLALRSEGEITVTVDGQILGTPAYMSPEQARGQSHRVDGRSDVYSLGAILYELLTGEHPFRGNREMLIYQVIHDDPQPPRKLNSRIPRDLETITLKCLGKEPGPRYRTASDLAADLKRWLSGEPIRARPISAPERLWRWSKRNPRVAGLSAAVVLLLVTVAMGASVAAVVVNHHRVLAEQAAQRERDASDAVNQYATLVSNSDLLNSPGMQPLREDLLREALQYYKEFQQQHENEPGLEIAVAASYFRTAQVQAEFRSFAQTFFSFVEGVTRLERALEKNPPPEELERWLAGGIYRDRLRTSLEDWGKTVEGVPSQAEGAIVIVNLEEAVSLWQRLAEQQPTVAGFKSDLASLHNFIGVLLREWGEYDQALPRLEKARDIWAALHREHPQDPDFAADLATAYGVISGVKWRKNELAEALYGQERSLEILNQLIVRHPKPAFVHDLAGSHYLVGRIQQALGKPDEALKFCTLARDRLKALHEQFPTIPLYQRDLATVYSSLGRLQREREQTADALDSLRRAVDLHRQLRLTKPGELYNLSSELALCAQLAAGGTPERQDYIEQAVTTLRKAVMSGYKDVKKLETDPDLAAIRDHAGYKELIEQLKRAEPK